MRHVLVHRVRCPVCCGADIMDQWAGNHSLCGVGLATSPGTCAGTRGFIRGKTHANGSPAYESPSAYKTREYGCQFWITRNPYGLPVQPVYILVSIRALQQQRGTWAVSKMKWDENRTHDGKFRPDNVNH